MKKILSILIIILISAGITINWLYDTPSGCFEKAFAMGSTVCHQIPSHSYIHGENQFPLCARCSGLYLGSFIGLIFFFTQGKKCALPKKEYIFLLVLLFIFWSGDGINSFISDFINRPFLYETTNTTRLISGFGMGLVMSAAVMTLFNVTVWQTGKDQPLLVSPWQVAGYAVMSTLSGWLLLSPGETLFQILAYISIVTVLTIITLLYTIFWVIVYKKEGQFTKLSSLILFLIAGFGTAMGQITLLTWLRNWVFG